MQRNKGLLLGCGGLLFACVGLVLCVALVSPTRMLLAAAGFRSHSKTADFLRDEVQAQPSPDWSALQPEGFGGVVQPAAVVSVQVDGQTAAIDASQLYAQRVEQVVSGSEVQAVFVEYDEAGANALLSQAMLQAPPEVTQRLRNMRVDLKPGAVVVYGDANTPLGWQPVGAVLVFDAAGTRFEVAGVDIGGQLYAAPPDGYFGDLAAQLEAEGNRLLDTAVIQNGLSVEQVYITETGLQIVAH